MGGLGKRLLRGLSLTCLPWTLMSIWEAMLQAHLCAAFFASVRVDCSQLFSAPFRWALGSLVHFRIICWVAVCLRMSVKNGVRVISCSELHSFGAYRTHDCVCISGSSFLARVRLVCAMLQAKHLSTAVTFERQEVYLLTGRNAAVRSQSQQVCRTLRLHTGRRARLQDKLVVAQEAR